MPFITGVLITIIGVLPYLKFLVMPDVVSGLFIGTGVTLIATGLSEISRFFSSTTELDGPALNLEAFDGVYRVSALLRNPGSVIVRDAKAVMELEYPDTETLSKILVEDCLRCGRCRKKRYLVNKANPIIKGEPLPWSIPERPIRRPAIIDIDVIRYTDYAHITSISPHQTTKLLLLEFIPLNDNKYLIRFFSEYGASGPPRPSTKTLSSMPLPGRENCS